MRLVPLPLALLLAVTALLAAAWAFVVPVGQAPDERAHVAYVQSLVERGEPPRAADRPPFSTEQRLALTAIDDDHHRGTWSKPPWAPAAEARWLAQARTLTAADRADGGGPGGDDASVAGNPPLYYAWASLAYRAAGGDYFARTQAMRLWSALLLLVTVTATWLLAGEVLGRRPLLRLTATAVVALHPMVVSVSAGVNPDALVYAAAAVAFWLCARLVVRGLAWPAVAGLAVAVAAAVAAKPTGAALAAPAAVALTIAAGRRLRPALATGRAPAAIALGATGLIVLAVAVIAQAGLALSAYAGEPSTSAAGMLGYLADFYVPGAGAAAGQEVPALGVWGAEAWAVFGWLDVRHHKAVYAVLALASVVALAAGLVATLRRGSGAQRAVLAPFAVGVVALLAGLHLFDYQLLDQLDRHVLQGRYLVPLVPPAAVVASAGLLLLPARARAGVAAIVLAGLVTLQVGSLALAAARWYA